MKSAAISMVLAALLLAPPRGFAGSHDVAGEFVVAEGLDVTLWSESPLFHQPTNIDVDQRGCIWVAEGVNYRTLRGKDVNQPESIPIGLDGVQVSLGTLANDMHPRRPEVQQRDKDAAKKFGVEVLSLAIGELNNIPYKSDPRTVPWVNDCIDVCQPMNCRIIPLKGPKARKNMAMNKKLKNPQDLGLTQTANEIVTFGQIR